MLNINTRTFLLCIVSRMMPRECTLWPLAKNLIANFERWHLFYCIHFYRNPFEIAWFGEINYRGISTQNVYSAQRKPGSLCVAKRYNCRILRCMKNELRTAEKWKIITFAHSDEENVLVNCRHIPRTSSSSFSLFTEFQLIKLYTIMKDSAIKTVWNSLLLIKVEFDIRHDI